MSGSSQKKYATINNRSKNVSQGIDVYDNLENLQMNLGKVQQNLEKQLSENLSNEDKFTKEEQLAKVKKDIDRLEEIKKDLDDALTFLVDNEDKNADMPEDHSKKGQATRQGTLRNNILRNTRAMQQAISEFKGFESKIKQDLEYADLMEEVDLTEEVADKVDDITISDTEAESSEANVQREETLESRIAEKEAELRSSAQRRAEYRREGATEQEAYENSNYARIVEEISQLRAEKEANNRSAEEVETPVQGTETPAQETETSTRSPEYASRTARRMAERAETENDITAARTARRIENAARRPVQRPDNSRDVNLADFLQGYRNVLENVRTLEQEAKTTDERIAEINERAEAARDRLAAARTPEERAAALNELNNNRYREDTEELESRRLEIDKAAEESKNRLAEINERRQTILQNAERHYNEQRSRLENNISQLESLPVQDASTRAALDKHRRDLNTLNAHMRIFRNGVQRLDNADPENPEVMNNLYNQHLSRLNRRYDNYRRDVETPSTEGRPDANSSRISELEAQNQAARDELNQIRTRALANRGEITAEDVDRIKELKDQIKNNNATIQAIKDGKPEQDTTEQKIDGPTNPDGPGGVKAIPMNQEPLRIEMKDQGLVKRPEVSIEKTGLQIFREQFNEMPNLKGRHALSENPFLKLPAALAPAAATIALTGGIGVIPVLAGTAIGAVAYAVSKPIIRAVTGQRKVEKQIEEQFKNMDEEEFLTMTQFLNEEQIIALKPHCAILNSLTKVAKTRCEQIKREKQEERTAIHSELTELEGKENPTKEDLERITALQAERAKLDSSIATLTKIPKEIKRGTQRKSAEYKGNMQGSAALNLFAKRNHSSAEYGQKLNEYADAERARDEETAFAKYEYEMGNDEESTKRSAQAARFDSLMQNIMKDNTYSKMGTHRSVFNGSRDGTPIMTVSDRVDNTIKHIAMLSTAVAGLFRVVTNVDKYVEAATLNAQEAERIAGINNQNVAQTQSQINQMKQGINVTGQETTEALMAEAGSRATAGEMTNVHTFGTVSHQNAGYVNADQLVNQAADQELSAISGLNPNNMTIVQKLRMIAGSIDQTGATQQTTANAMNGMTVRSGVSHSGQETLMQASQAGKQVEAKLINKLADTLEKLHKFKPGQTVAAAVQKIGKDYLGPIMTAMGTAIGIEVDASKDRKEKKFLRTGKTNSGNER